jgi:hypothetical protein
MVEWAVRGRIYEMTALRVGLIHGLVAERIKVETIHKCPIIFFLLPVIVALLSTFAALQKNAKLSYQFWHFLTRHTRYNFFFHCFLPKARRKKKVNY